MKTITVLSGKGGVGKSSVSASLAFLLSRENKIVAADCDVDAANLALLFGLKKLTKNEKISTNSKAFVNKKAKNCKNIVNNCAFSAISWNEKKQLPEINKFMCEGCGVCKILCPQGITIRRVENAVVGVGKTEYGFPVISGQLEMGEAGSGKVVTVVKERARKIVKEQGAKYLIVDSAPGIGCPVIASVRGSDYILAVTEPTPTAFRALQRVLRVVEHFDIPCGILINKTDLNVSFVKKIENFAREKKIKIMARIPYSKNFVEAMIKMKPVVEINPDYEKTFKEIIKRINLL